MAKKKVMLFIVEGPTDETSLSTVLNRIFSSATVKFQVIHGDILTRDFTSSDKIVAAARENAENDRKKIVDEANREAVSIAEAAMEKLLAKETSRAYDAFVNAAEGVEKHEHE